MMRKYWHPLSFQLVLYTLQGVPMGLSASIPILLASRGTADLSALRVLAWVSWPFSLKLIWAPIVDCFFVQKWGRRKSWIVPVQLLAAACMISAGGFIDAWLEEGDTVSLAACFFGLFCLMATQDIAVDGWALSMLPKGQRHLASYTNAVGQSLGIYIGKGLFLSISDSVSLGTFTFNCGLVMLGTTFTVFAFKEQTETEDSDTEEGVFDVTPMEKLRHAYGTIYGLVKLRPVFLLSLVLLVIRVPFGAADNYLEIELVTRGFDKERVAALSPILMPLSLVIPIFVGGLVSHIKRGFEIDSTGVLRVGYLFRLIFLPVASLVYFYMPNFSDAKENPMVAEIMYLCYYIAYEIISGIMFLSQMSMFAEVADPKVGGIYMTLLNTVANMGNKWPGNFAIEIMRRTSVWGDPFLITNMVLIMVGLGTAVPLWRLLGNIRQVQQSEWKLVRYKKSV